MATTKHLDNAGEEARRLYSTIISSGKDYNSKRKQRTEELRRALEPVWAALAKGQSVNGCSDKLSWCKWVNPESKHPERWFYRVMGEKVRSTTKKRQRPIIADVGTMLECDAGFGRRVYRIRKFAAESDKLSTNLVMDVMIEKHLCSEGEDGWPLCKPSAFRRHFHKKSNYLFAGKGEKVSCIQCLSTLKGIEEKKAKAAAA